MAESGTGAIFTQSGVPVKGSADYQRVFDSRWRFMEIAFDRQFTVDLPARPAVAPSARYNDRVMIVKHGLGFVPLFETDFQDQYYNYMMLAGASMYADDQYFFFDRFVTNSGAESQHLTFNIRVYNFPVLTDYVAPKGLPQGTQSPRSTIGVKFLDGQTPGVDVSDNAVRGFSVDSTKKILSIHRHGLAKINDWNGRYCYVSAIDTATDIFTIYPDANATTLKSQDISWAATPGQAVTYFPNDFSTYPGGMPNNGGSSSVMYLIPVDATHVKIATSYENALNGIAIDITSAGSLKGQFSATSSPGDNSNAILHDVGYPPTFLMAKVNNEIRQNGAPTIVPYFIGPMIDIVLARVRSDTRYLYFGGIQSVFSGWFAYVIMKDPAELAQ